MKIQWSREVSVVLEAWVLTGLLVGNSGAFEDSVPTLVVQKEFGLLGGLTVVGDGLWSGDEFDIPGLIFPSEFKTSFASFLIIAVSINNCKQWSGPSDNLILLSFAIEAQ